jgi:polysaccharide pyruvyl transferase WcaK-like protein
LVTRVLIHNSDSPKNRGDRAILVGMIELVRRTVPDAEIWSLSQYAERDERWYGIRFLPQSPYSTNPLEWIALLRLARRSDVVLWGGGEILKDYTNRLGLVYWFVKLIALSLANPRIIGAFQGIGPTSAASSKRLIRRTVDRCRVFIVRDDESKEKLEDWGARVPVIASYDPAVLGEPVVVPGSGASREFGLGLRRWFHYERSGFLPRRFRPRSRRSDAARTADVDRYTREVASLADGLIERHDLDAVFFPMHLAASEGDAEFATEVIARMRNASRTRVVAGDDLSPAEYASAIGAMRFFVASRLHSAIIATTQLVPSFVLYYVDKGRLYFEQLGMERYSAPIEAILEDGASAALGARIDELVKNEKPVRDDLRASLAEMSSSIEASFSEALRAIG